MLTVVFYLLAIHPEQERKLIEEIEDKIGAETPTFENVKDLEYLKGVQNEALRYEFSVKFLIVRLYPPVPINFRQAVADDILPNGIVVEKGVSTYENTPTDIIDPNWVFTLCDGKNGRVLGMS